VETRPCANRKSQIANDTFSDFTGTLFEVTVTFEMKRGMCGWIGVMIACSVTQDIDID
jgi:hypothetical protein